MAEVTKDITYLTQFIFDTVKDFNIIVLFSFQCEQTIHQNRLKGLPSLELEKPVNPDLELREPYKEANTVYHGYWSKDTSQKEGIGVELNLKSGEIYQGEWVCGHRQGKGFLLLGSGDFYVGAFVEDKRQGQGTLKLTNGNFYEGEWQNNKREGKGTYVWEKDDIYKKYVGEFKENMRHGTGTMEYMNNGMYKGEWKHNRRHGKGDLQSDNGEYYSGDWKDDMRDGMGTRKYANGDLYEGEFVKDQKDGYGKYKWANGKTYSGEWKKGARTGKATMVWTNGSKYEGDFKDGQREGYGIYMEEDGTLYRGEWKADKTEGFGYIKYNNGDEYIGDFAGNKKNGEGMYIWKAGYVYKGNMLHDKKHGKGILYRLDLETEGDWDKGKFIEPGLGAEETKGEIDEENPPTSAKELATSELTTQFKEQQLSIQHIPEDTIQTNNNSINKESTEAKKEQHYFVQHIQCISKCQCLLIYNNYHYPFVKPFFFQQQLYSASNI
eukprot:TRINITY_DN933_c0_g1_i1.p1 TRINITY_DN933_c0_g1~~TRINITY_DN933_c0_g1_i1.p1  ORF type:complete len:494 (+),score=69.56 TRINITY_DN933_c0_g1_i1:742-2223(+)